MPPGIGGSPWETPDDLEPIPSPNLQKKLDELQKKYDKISAEKANLLKKISDGDIQIKALTKDGKSLKDQIDGKIKEITVLENKTQEAAVLEKDLKGEKTKNKGLLSRIKGLTGDVLGFKQTIRDQYIEGDDREKTLIFQRNSSGIFSIFVVGGVLSFDRWR